MTYFNLPGGSNPAAAKAAKLQRDLQAKAASRRYDAHCRACGLSAFEAQLLAPKLVKRGDSLRRVEERHRKQAEFRAQKQAMERRFGDQRSAP